MYNQIITIQDAKRSLKKYNYHVKKLPKYDDNVLYDVWMYTTYGKYLKANLTEDEVIDYANIICTNNQSIENIKLCNKCYHYWLNKKTTNKDEICYGRIDYRNCFRNTPYSHTYRIRKKYKSRKIKNNIAE